MKAQRTSKEASASRTSIKKHDGPILQQGQVGKSVGRSRRHAGGNGGPTSVHQTDSGSRANRTRRQGGHHQAVQDDGVRGLRGHAGEAGQEAETDGPTSIKLVGYRSDTRSDHSKHEPVRDRNGVELSTGARVKYFIYDNKAARAKHGGKKTRMGTVLGDCCLGSCVDLVLDGDPFGTYVQADRIEFAGAYNTDHPLIKAINQHRLVPMGRKNRNRSNEGTMAKQSAKELRREAKSLGVKGWEEMDADELKAAIKKKSKGGTSRTEKAMKSAGRDKVKTSKTKKDNEAVSKAAKAKKKAAKDDHEVAENGNPFRPGTNLFLITEELIKGGKRSKMVARLSKKIELKPRKNVDDFDEVAELDRRVLITAQLLEKDHGFTKEKDGRGPDATIKVTAP